MVVPLAGMVGEVAWTHTMTGSSMGQCDVTLGICRTQCVLFCIANLSLSIAF